MGDANYDATYSDGRSAGNDGRFKQPFRVIFTKLWNIIEEETKRRGFNERVILALSDAAHGYKVRNNSYRTVAEVSEQVASRDLLMLSDAELLIPHGEKRGRYYLAGKWLKEVRERVRQPRCTTDPFSKPFERGKQQEMF